MAINKKLIHFNTFENFNSKKLSANIENTQYTLGVDGEIQSGSPDILYQSIVYIKDTKQQWTHGQLYEGKTAVNDTINSFDTKVITLKIHLKEGWNYVSFYVETDLEKLQNALGKNCVQIKSRVNEFIKYDEIDGWCGSLETISPTEMYEISVNKDCDIYLTGKLLNPNNIEIILNPNNTTYISYPLNIKLPITDALVNLTPTEGDVISCLSNATFVTYYEGIGWYGLLLTFIPGEGYKYTSNNSSTVTFTYPDTYYKPFGNVEVSSELGESTIKAASLDLVTKVSEEFKQYVDDKIDNLNKVTLTIELDYTSETANSTWVSFYVNTTLEDLYSALGTKGLKIETCTDGTGTANLVNIYDSNTNTWSGNITELDLSLMYNIYISEAVSIEVFGELLNPKDITITLNPGWNLIGYPVNTSIDIEVALENLNPEKGDIIKGYDNGVISQYLDEDIQIDGETIHITWDAPMTLEPGKGYEYYNTSSETKTFTFPTELDIALSTKQDKLVSGTNIKTVNGTSILGSGDISFNNATITTDGLMSSEDKTKLNNIDLSKYLPLTGGTVTGEFRTKALTHLANSTSAVLKAFPESEASGFLSTAIGYKAKVYGNYATSIGYLCRNFGNNSAVIGYASSNGMGSTDTSNPYITIAYFRPLSFTIEDTEVYGVNIPKGESVSYIYNGIEHTAENTNTTYTAILVVIKNTSRNILDIPLNYASIYNSITNYCNMRILSITEISDNIFAVVINGQGRVLIDNLYQSYVALPVKTNSSLYTGQGGINCGYSTDSTGKFSFTSGNQSFNGSSNSIINGSFNYTGGSYINVFGQDNTVITPNSSFVAGNNNFVSASSFISGNNNLNVHNYTKTLGDNNITTSQNQVIIGNYNSTNTNGLFIVANGTSNTNRKNIFIISSTGVLNVFDNIIPIVENKDIGSTYSKWRDVYADNFKGNADTATKVNNALTIKKGSTTDTFDGSTAKTIDITDLQNIGDLNNLQTSNKSNIVSAINEIKQSIVYLPNQAAYDMITPVDGVLYLIGEEVI